MASVRDEDPPSGTVHPDPAAVRHDDARIRVPQVHVEDGEEGWLAMRGDPAMLPDAVRDACAEAGVSLRALLPGDRTLEDAVIGAIA